MYISVLNSHDREGNGTYKDDKDRTKQKNAR